MKIRMNVDNCLCWKAGQVFEVHRYKDKSLWIECDDPYTLGHSLMDIDGNDIFEVKDCSDGVPVE